MCLSVIGKILKTVAENPLEIHYIDVEITDINDHSPTFPVREKHLEISENAVPQSTNSVQHYKLSQNVNFNLEVKDRGEDGKIPVLILKSPLDREITKIFSLLLTAVDGGRPPKSGSVEITVDVLDINDNMPVFTKDVYSVMLNENTPVGTTIVQMNATDLDQGSNGEIIYSLGNRVNDKLQKLFYINSLTGEIIVKGLLDFEVRDSYEIDIQASDKGSPPLTADKSVIVRIVDINDNAPEIEVTSFSSSIPEDSRPGTTVALISTRYSISEEQKNGTAVGNIARDLGIEHKALKERGFRIMSASGESLFKVNMDDGGLYVNGNIDREEVCETTSICLINLKIALENPLEIHYVTVEILDINDHAPNFSQKTKHLEIGESALPGARFQLQAARDPDSGSNSIQRYKLSDNDHFRLEVKDRDEDGKIPILVLQKPLDRELATIVKLLITAVDGGKPPKSGTIEIIIDVLDINDNVPVFTKDDYTVRLDENLPIGTTVIQLNATDSDEGSNGEIVYSIGHNVNNKLRELFEINAITGEIIVKGLLDFEVKDKYEIDIQASDKGLVPMTTDRSVTIKIVDLNDNAPEIEVTSFSSTIPENSRSGTTVALISVSDLDSGMNGKVFCSILEDIPFKLIPSSHDSVYSLVTMSSLDRETTHRYDITLLAKDAGDPHLSSVKTITVHVSDVNDNSPEFYLPPYTFYVLENTVPGTSLDNTEENKYTSFININSENGEIYALKSFDFETVKAFQFKVAAVDSGNPPLSSNVTVNVYILDQNDNYLQDTNYDGTLCHSIQYRSGDKRYMLVGPRMSIGSTIVPGSNGNTLVVPDRRRGTSGEVRKCHVFFVQISNS
uniref:Cadherin domain-containing protein n=1 Tax=Electrophorus electricus TaxID=8005 RepID=A0AAY5EKH8_ELEEL